MKIKPHDDESVNSQQDSVLHQEYMEYMETGTTNIEALVQVAITNELDVVTVFDALVRTEHCHSQ